MTDDGFDAECFDALLRESLHEAAVRDVSADALVTLLRQHATSIEQCGLDAHVGLDIPSTSTEHDDYEREDAVEST